MRPAEFFIYIIYTFFKFIFANTAVGFTGHSRLRLCRIKKSLVYRCPCSGVHLKHINITGTAGLVFSLITTEFARKVFGSFGSECTASQDENIFKWKKSHELTRPGSATYSCPVKTVKTFLKHPDCARGQGNKCAYAIRPRFYNLLRFTVSYRFHETCTNCLQHVQDVSYRLADFTTRKCIRNVVISLEYV